MACVSPELECDIHNAQLSPGNILLETIVPSDDPETKASWFPGAEELFAVDVMAGEAYSKLWYNSALVELEIIGPTGCMFVAPSANAPFRPFVIYEMKATSWAPFTNDTNTVRITRFANSASPLIEVNDNNSTSFWLGIKGRSGGQLSISVVVYATEITARSCRWEIRDMSLGDRLGGRLSAHAPCT